MSLSGSTVRDAPLAETPRPAADRFMRALLRVDTVDRSARVERSANRYFGTSLVVSGIRCLITYLLIPVLFPILGLSGVFSAPIGIALSLIAGVTGVLSLRRFWVSDHRMRWIYTAFIGFVFAVLIIALAADISRLVSGS